MFVRRIPKKALILFSFLKRCKESQVELRTPIFELFNFLVLHIRVASQKVRTAGV